MTVWHPEHLCYIWTAFYFSNNIGFALCSGGRKPLGEMCLTRPSFSKGKSVTQLYCNFQGITWDLRSRSFNKAAISTFLSSSEPVRWQKEVYLTFLQVVQDEGRNTVCFEAVPQCCKPLHSDNAFTRPSAVSSIRHCHWRKLLCYSQWETLGPLCTWLGAIQQGANPDPFLSPHLEQWLEAEDNFFSLRGNFRNVLSLTELLVHGQRACISCSW